MPTKTNLPKQYIEYIQSLIGELKDAGIMAENPERLVLQAAVNLLADHLAGISDGETEKWNYLADIGKTRDEF